MMGLKYTKKHYQNKINQLEMHAETVRRHLDTLEGYEEEINQFWDDEQGLEYAKKISKAVQGCRNALDRIDGLKRIYSEAFGSLEKTDTLIDESLDTIGSVIDSLGISIK